VHGGTCLLNFEIFKETMIYVPFFLMFSWVGMCMWIAFALAKEVGILEPNLAV
jgi:hypothetical protein